MRAGRELTPRNADPTDASSTRSSPIARSVSRSCVPSFESGRHEWRMTDGDATSNRGQLAVADGNNPPTGISPISVAGSWPTRLRLSSVRQRAKRLALA
jgi:hypothetical protein